MRRSRIATLLVVGGLALLVIFFWTRSRSDDTSHVANAGASAKADVEESIATPGPSESAPPTERLAEQDSTDGRRRLVAGPHGKVVEAGSGEPVEGLTVQMRFGKKVLAEAITQSDGTFHLPRPDRSRRIIEVVSEGWRISPRMHRLDDEQSEGLTDLLFRAERIVAAPLRGRVLDRRTGEPVPDFLVQARGPRGQVQKSSTEGDSDKGEPSFTFELHGRIEMALHAPRPVPLGFSVAREIDDHRGAAAILPPSTVSRAPVVLWAEARETKAWATSSALTSRLSRLEPAR